MTEVFSRTLNASVDIRLLKKILYEGDSQLIASCFGWANTPQGGTFWAHQHLGLTEEGREILKKVLKEQRKGLKSILDEIED